MAANKDDDETGTSNRKIQLYISAFHEELIEKVVALFP